MRINVYVPDELVAEARSRHPALNASHLYQAALRQLVECAHETVVCRLCAEEIPAATLVAHAVDDLYGAVMDAMEGLVWRGSTAEGAARVLAHVARARGVPLAFRRPLPRATRAERELVAERAAS